MRDWKKKVCLFLCITLLMGIVTVFPAQTEAAFAPAGFPVGFLADISSPASDSIPISSRSDLEKIGNTTGFPLNGKYHLTRPIDMNGAEWTPIENFSGIFDGQGYSIDGLYIFISSNTSSAGLFASINGALIENLIVNIHSVHGISASGYAGGIVGEVIGGSTGNEIVNCIVAGGRVEAMSYAGGMVGGSSGVVELVITESFAANDVVGDLYAGGLVGYVLGGSGSKIDKTYAVGRVDSGSISGGLIGGIEGFMITNSFAKGRASGACVGGLIGSTLNSPDNNNIENVYASGDVISTGASGGLIGQSNSALIPGSNFSLEVGVITRNSTRVISGNPINTIGATKTHNDMTESGGFEGASGWNFISEWGWDLTGSYLYPVLSVVIPVYTVTFDANGGTLNGSEHVLVKEGDVVYPHLADPTKAVRINDYINDYTTDYTFEGWTENPNAPSSLYDFSAPVMADLTLYALWESQTVYTVIVMDVSYSMLGAIGNLKREIYNLVQNIEMNSAVKNKIAIVVYAENAVVMKDFSDGVDILGARLETLMVGNGTNTYAGLKLAKELLDDDLSKTNPVNPIKRVVLLADGLPNLPYPASPGLETPYQMSDYLFWRQANDAYDIAAQLIADNCIVDSIAFLHASGEQLLFSRKFLSEIRTNSASILKENPHTYSVIPGGSYYELSDPNDLSLVFDEISKNIQSDQTPQVYQQITIACPVDVTITHNGRTITSDMNQPGFINAAPWGRIDYSGEDADVKTVSLYEDIPVDIHLTGNGTGFMDYTVEFFDSTGNATQRYFAENVPVTEDTVIETNTDWRDSIVLMYDGYGNGQINEITVPMSYPYDETGSYPVINLPGMAYVTPNRKTFTTVLENYNNAGMEQTFTIKNTSTEKITNLAAAIGVGSFEIVGGLSVSTLNPGESAVINVRPVGGLPNATYYDALIITGDNDVELVAVLEFTVNSIPVYSAAANPQGKVFAAAREGYGNESMAQTFFIENTGTEEITNLYVVLDDGRYFTVNEEPASSSIDVGGVLSFSVKPVNGLIPNETPYADTLIITADNGINISVPVSFTVSFVQVYTASINPSAYEFTTALEGYGNFGMEREFTIENTGTGKIQELSASLGSSYFVISKNLSADTVDSGGTVTLSVVPVNGIPASDTPYTDTLTICGDNGVVLEVSISFKVDTIPVHIVYGDVNGNGTVNSADLIFMLRYFAQPNISVDLAAADVNADGIINGADLVLLMKYFAQPGIILGTP